MSGRAAAHLFGLLKGEPPSPEVTAPLKRRIEGVRLRRGRIEPRDRATYRVIPVTSVPRTLTDLAADFPLDALARACHEAGVRYRTTPAEHRGDELRRYSWADVVEEPRQMLADLLGGKGAFQVAISPRSGWKISSADVPKERARPIAGGSNRG